MTIAVHPGRPGERLPFGDHPLQGAAGPDAVHGRHGARPVFEERRGAREPVRVLVFHVVHDRHGRGGIRVRPIVVAGVPHQDEVRLLVDAERLRVEGRGAGHRAQGCHGGGCRGIRLHGHHGAPGGQARVPEAGPQPEAGVDLLDHVVHGKGIQGLLGHHPLQGESVADALGQVPLVHLDAHPGRGHACTEPRDVRLTDTRGRAAHALELEVAQLHAVAGAQAELVDVRGGHLAAGKGQETDTERGEAAAHRHSRGQRLDLGERLRVLGVAGHRVEGPALAPQHPGELHGAHRPRALQHALEGDECRQPRPGEKVHRTRGRSGRRASAARGTASSHHMRGTRRRPSTRASRMASAALRASAAEYRTPAHTTCENRPSLSTRAAAVSSTAADVPPSALCRPTSRNQPEVTSSTPRRARTGPGPGVPGPEPLSPPSPIPVSWWTRPRPSGCASRRRRYGRSAGADLPPSPCPSSRRRRNR